MIFASLPHNEDSMDGMPSIILVGIFATVGFFVLAIAATFLQSSDSERKCGCCPSTLKTKRLRKLIRHENYPDEVPHSHGRRGSFGGAESSDPSRKDPKINGVAVKNEDDIIYATPNRDVPLSRATVDADEESSSYAYARVEDPPDPNTNTTSRTTAAIASSPASSHHYSPPWGEAVLPHQNHHLHPAWDGLDTAHQRHGHDFHVDRPRSAGSGRLGQFLSIETPPVSTMGSKSNNVSPASVTGGGGGLPSPPQCPLPRALPELPDSRSVPSHPPAGILIGGGSALPSLNNNRTAKQRRQRPMSSYWPSPPTGPLHRPYLGQQQHRFQPSANQNPSQSPPPASIRTLRRTAINSNSNSNPALWHPQGLPPPPPLNLPTPDPSSAHDVMDSMDPPYADADTDDSISDKQGDLSYDVADGRITSGGAGAAIRTTHRRQSSQSEIYACVDKVAPGSPSHCGGRSSQRHVPPLYFTAALDPLRLRFPTPAGTGGGPPPPLAYLNSGSGDIDTTRQPPVPTWKSRLPPAPDDDKTFYVKIGDGDDDDGDDDDSTEGGLYSRVSRPRGSVTEDTTLNDDDEAFDPLYSEVDKVFQQQPPPTCAPGPSTSKQQPMVHHSQIEQHTDHHYQPHPRTGRINSEALYTKIDDDSPRPKKTNPGSPKKEDRDTSREEGSQQKALVKSKNATNLRAGLQGAPGSGPRPGDGHIYSGIDDTSRAAHHFRPGFSDNENNVPSREQHLTGNSLAWQRPMNLNDNGLEYTYHKAPLAVLESVSTASSGYYDPLYARVNEPLYTRIPDKEPHKHSQYTAEQRHGEHKQQHSSRHTSPKENGLYSGIERRSEARATGLLRRSTFDASYLGAHHLVPGREQTAPLSHAPTINNDTYQVINKVPNNNDVTYEAKGPSMIKGNTRAPEGQENARTIHLRRTFSDVGHKNSLYAVIDKPKDEGHDDSGSHEPSSTTGAVKKGGTPKKLSRDPYEEIDAATPTTSKQQNGTLKHQRQTSPLKSPPAAPLPALQYSSSRIAPRDMVAQMNSYAGAATQNRPTTSISPLPPTTSEDNRKHSSPAARQVKRGSPATSTSSTSASNSPQSHRAGASAGRLVISVGSPDGSPARPMPPAPPSSLLSRPEFNNDRVAVHAVPNADQRFEQQGVLGTSAEPSYRYITVREPLSILQARIQSQSGTEDAGARSDPTSRSPTRQIRTTVPNNNNNNTSGPGPSDAIISTTADGTLSGHYYATISEHSYEVVTEINRTASTTTRDSTGASEYNSTRHTPPL